MCTLIVIHRRIPGAPLVVAANRDEYYDRPATGPAVFPVAGDAGGDGFSVLAPRDSRAGGTWLGINGHEVFAAVTNRPDIGADSSRRSRGMLVLDALRFDSAARAARDLGSIPNDRYSGFNLVVADRQEAFSVTPSAQRKAGRVSVRRFEPGTHVIGNAAPNDRTHPKTRRILDAAKQVERLPADDVLGALSGICRDHAFLADGAGASPDEPAGNVCVHLGEYGTRSSVLLRLGDRSRSGASADSSLQYSDGAPCDHPYLDFTPLLRELRHRASSAGEELMARNAS